MRNQWDPVLGRRAIQVDQQRARRPCPRCWRLRLSSPDFPGLPTFPHPRLLQTPGTPASAELSRARVQLIYLRRTAYVRVYVAVCLAVFFLSPHFSKREGTPEIRAMASRIICWRQDAKRLPPPLPIHFLSAQHRLHLAAPLPCPPPRRSRQHRARRRPERGFAADDDTGTSTSTKTLAETRSFLPRLLIANA